jgi:hypothetical protein
MADHARLVFAELGQPLKGYHRAATTYERSNQRGRPEGCMNSRHLPSTERAQGVRDPMASETGATRRSGPRSQMQAQRPQRVALGTRVTLQWKSESTCEPSARPTLQRSAAAGHRTRAPLGRPTSDHRGRAGEPRASPDIAALPPPAATSASRWVAPRWRALALKVR